MFGDEFLAPELTVNFRFCEIGEMISDGECHVCPVGAFSLFANSTSCEECPANAQCLGSDEIQVNEGFWRYNHETDNIYECLNPDACPGGFVEDGELPVECGTGYGGYLCSDCIPVDDEPYEEVRAGVCSKCLNPVVNALRIVLFVVVILVYLGVMIGINIRKTSDSTNAIVFKILTNYIQVITATLSFNLSFPKYVTAPFRPLTDVESSASTTILSVDCLFKDFSIPSSVGGSIDLFKMVFVALSPLLIFLGFLLFWLLVGLLYRPW